jgi:CRISPR-associated protein Cmr1
MNGHLSLEELKKQESEIFGGTDGDNGGRSRVIIFYPKITKEYNTKISTTPHHRNGYCSTTRPNCNYRNGNCMKSIKRDAKLYSFDLKINFDENTISQTDLERLVKTTLLLGGIGKRARRGFGSIKITSINNNPCLMNLSNYATFVSSIPTRTTSAIDYPFIKQIELGRLYTSYEELLISVGESSHANRHDCLGYAYSNDRLSSPIYVSVIKVAEKEYYPIITTLKTPNRITTITNQTSFKTAIL